MLFLSAPKKRSNRSLPPRRAAHLASSVTRRKSSRVKTAKERPIVIQAFVSWSTQAVVAPVPKDFRPKSDVPLMPTAHEAVRVSEGWLAEKNAPSPGPDGRGVMYVYGAGLHTVVCEPLRVCMIELEAGEKIMGEPHIGDSVRWNIAPAMYGTEDQATPVIILKPQMPGLDTNLLITTDRRAYYLRLISKQEPQTGKVQLGPFMREVYYSFCRRKWKRSTRMTTEQRINQAYYCRIGEL
jgi:type IV secretory pathway VirB9-like protein